MSTPRPREFLLYDCFTEQRFGGNVGGVVLDADGLGEADMQRLAAELNAPVTGFVTATSPDRRDVAVRFFMPKTEIAMCGHVTIGLFSRFAQDLPPGEHAFVMRPPAGPVDVRVLRRHAGADIMMGMRTPEAADRDADIARLAAALGSSVDAVTAVAPCGAWNAGLDHFFVAFDRAEAVERLEPDFTALAAFCRAAQVHTVGCFARRAENEDGAAEIVIRDFCPALGVDEAPASGTTNAALAGYLATTGLVGDGPQRINADQGAQIGRPSRIASRFMASNRGVSDVSVGGRAVLSASGVFEPI